MDLQTPHDKKLEDDDKLDCSSIDSSLHQVDRFPHNHSSYNEDYSVLSPGYNESCVAPGCGLDWQHKLTSELHWYNTYVPRDTKLQHDYTYKYNQQIRKEIVRCISSFVVSNTVFLGIFYNIWSILLKSTSVQPLQKEHDHHHSIWPSLLGLFGFMVLVCAVAAMILAGAVFTRTQKAMLIFWVVLMHLQSANSVVEVFVILIGGLFMGWYAFGEK